MKYYLCIFFVMFLILSIASAFNVNIPLPSNTSQFNVNNSQCWQGVCTNPNTWVNSFGFLNSFTESDPVCSAQLLDYNKTSELNTLYLGVGENSTLARKGNCPANQVVMNSTNGVQCVSNSLIGNATSYDGAQFTATNGKLSIKSSTLIAPLTGSYNAEFETVSINSMGQVEYKTSGDYALVCRNSLNWANQDMTGCDYGKLYLAPPYDYDSCDMYCRNGDDYTACQNIDCCWYYSYVYNEAIYWDGNYCSGP